MSPAFYKGKLQGFVEIAKRSVRETINHFEGLCAKGPVEIEMIKEISDSLTSMILKCIFGEDLSAEQIDFYENGILLKKNVSFMLRTCF
jgi:hypothetical protein